MGRIWVPLVVLDQCLSDGAGTLVADDQWHPEPEPAVEFAPGVGCVRS